MLKKITIIGSSSGRNAGDAALLSGIMDAIDEACGRRLSYDIPTFRPEFIRKTYPNDATPISMLPWDITVGMFGFPTYGSVCSADMTVIYDAMLFDRELFNPLRNYMSTAYLMLPAAKRRGKILGLYNAGTGPVNTPLGKKMLREICNLVDFITVRDSDSLELLRSIGVTNESILVTADAALTVPPAPSDRITSIISSLGLADAGGILAFNVNSYLNSWTGLNQKSLSADEFADIYARAVSRLAAETRAPILFVATQHSDLTITKAVMSRVKSDNPIRLLSNVDYNHFEIKGVLSRVALLFAMRLHASILCTSAGTPAAALVFQKKVQSYYNLLGLQENTLSFADFSEERLFTHVMNAWHKRELTRKLLSQRIPELQKEALKAARVVALIDQGIAPAEAIKRIANEVGASNSPLSPN